MPQWKERLLNVIAVDTRSLAAYRIAVGYLWLFELIIRMTELRAYYSDFGILSRDQARLHFPETTWLSINMLSGETWFQAALFLVAIAFALLMILGVWTRGAVIVTWFLCISIQSRNEMVLYGGDHLIRVLLFWAMFLPLDGAWSLSKQATEVRRIASVWTAALLLQIGFLYLFAALLKSGREWHSEGTALYFAFSYDQLTGDWGRALLNYPGLLRILTPIILATEFAAFPMLFFPSRTSAYRSVGVAILASLHLGIVAFMALYLIPWANLAALLVFVPSEWWDLWKTKRPVTVVTDRSLVPGIAMIAYTLIWNLNSANPNWDQPAPWKAPAFMVRMDQNWGFYAPRPLTRDGWWIFPGFTDDGRAVDAWTMESTAPSENKPNGVHREFWSAKWLSSFNAHWMAYSINSLEPRATAHHRYLLQYLCRRWNEGGRPHLRTVTDVYMEEITLPPGLPTQVSRKVLAEVNCD